MGSSALFVLKTRGLVAGFVAFLLLAVPASPLLSQADLSPASWPKSELARYSKLQEDGGPKKLGKGRRGMVVGTTGPLAVRAGLEALKQGGSAVDAAIATSLAQVTLAAGSWVSFAGIFTMIHYEADTRKVTYLNGEFTTVLGEDDPLSIPFDAPSGRTAMVPGFMAGVERAHDRFGRLPWEELFAPAIYFAEEGFVLDVGLASTLEFRRGVLSRTAEGRSIFFKPDGNLYQAGDLFKQPALAETLRNVASEGAGYMYEGAWGEQLVAALAAEGGKMTMADLAAYKPILKRAKRARYRDVVVWAPSKPGSGGAITARALRALKAHDFGAAGHYTESADSLYELMANTRAIYNSLPPLGHSDAVVTVDEEGNVAAVLHSINTLAWGETGIFVDGVSIPDAAKRQQRRILTAGPGKRIWSGTLPVIVTRKRQPVLASSAIGNGLFEATIQSLVNVLDFGKNPKQAIESPIFRSPLRSDDPVSRWPTRVTQNQFDGDLLQTMRDRGIPILEMSPLDFAGTGFWAAVTVGDKKPRLQGFTSEVLNGWAEGY